METDVNDLPELLSTILTAQPFKDRVLSVYLDTTPAQVAGTAYLLTFRDLAKSLREKLPIGESNAFEAAVGQAEDYLREQVIAKKPGVALFTSGSPAYFYATALPRPPIDVMVWDALPVVQPLAQAIEGGSRVGIAFFDARQARLLTIQFGQIEERRSLLDDVPGKQRGGGWAALSQSRFARHREDHLLRHTQRVVAELSALSQSHPFDRLVLAGPPEALSVLRHHLPAPLRRRVVGSTTVAMFASDAEVVRAAQEVIEAGERRVQTEDVVELLDGEATDHVVLGLEATLAALGEGRVHALVIADTFSALGGECPSCGRLIAGPGPCPICATPIGRVARLADRAIRRALANGATVEIVSGEAAALLATREGLGAWTRYATAPP